MRRHIAYLKAVLRHKWFVFLACLQWGVPIWSAILHDWDKFLPDEWFAYARTFYKPDGSKQYAESVDFARAWMQHQHRNKHHWQWWLLYGSTPSRFTNCLTWDRGNTQIVIKDGIYDWSGIDNHIIEPTPMSDSARREMLADWFGAGRAYKSDWTPLEPRKWYEANKDKMILHPDTRAWIETQLAQQLTK